MSGVIWSQQVPGQFRNVTQKTTLFLYGVSIYGVFYSPFYVFLNIYPCLCRVKQWILHAAFLQRQKSEEAWHCGAPQKPLQTPCKEALCEVSGRRERCPTAPYSCTVLRVHTRSSNSSNSNTKHLLVVGLEACLMCAAVNCHGENAKQLTHPTAALFSFGQTEDGSWWGKAWRTDFTAYYSENCTVLQYYNPISLSTALGHTRYVHVYNKPKS